MPHARSAHRLLAAVLAFGPAVALAQQPTTAPAPTAGPWFASRQLRDPTECVR